MGPHLMFNAVDLVTHLVNLHIPKSAVKVETTPAAVLYLHPTKGWRSVSWKRIGVNPFND